MKQVLLMMPSYYDFDEVITSVLVKHSDCIVTAIDTSPKLAYRNNFDRVINFFSKLLLRKNLKPEMHRKRILRQINSLTKVDYLVVNRVDLIDDIIFDTVIKKAEHKILLLWDSLSKVGAPIDRLAHFNVIYSFDSNDCKNYNFKKIENFHFWDFQAHITPKYDAIYLGTLDQRESDLIKIMEYLKIDNKTFKAFLHVPRGKKIQQVNEIEILNKIIPFKDSISFANQGSLIVDLAHKNQTGLSFRVFEAMFLRKKLITTNTNIREYDFYDPHNIFVLDDVNEINIPNDFWTTQYKEIAKEIVDKYAAENWVKKILSNG